MRCLLAFGLLVASWPTESANAHGGGLDASGCHNDRKRGGYHCHRGSYNPPPVAPVYRAPTPTRPAVPQTLFGNVEATSEGDVETAQRLLAKLGYDPGAPDGIMGDRTRRAIEAFESDNGLAVTGLVRQDTINAMIEKLGG